jgi:Rrf2 family protein
MIAIAEADQSKGILQKDIAINQSLPNKYLDQIILGLKVAGLINNVKGHKSGYILTRKPEDISIYDIHCAFEAGICVIECMYPQYQCDREKQCNVKGFWTGLNAKITDHFKATSLAQIINKQTDNLM